MIFIYNGSLAKARFFSNIKIKGQRAQERKRDMTLPNQRLMKAMYLCNKINPKIASDYNTGLHTQKAYTHSGTSPM